MDDGARFSDWGWRGTFIKPKDEERGVVGSGSGLVLAKGIRNPVTVPSLPDGADHDIDAVAANV